MVFYQRLGKFHAELNGRPTRETTARLVSSRIRRAPDSLPVTGALRRAARCARACFAAPAVALVEDGARTQTLCAKVSVFARPWRGGQASCDGGAGVERRLPVREPTLDEARDSSGPASPGCCRRARRSGRLFQACNGQLPACPLRTWPAKAQAASGQVRVHATVLSSRAGRRARPFAVVPAAVVVPARHTRHL